MPETPVAELPRLAEAPKKKEVPVMVFGYGSVIDKETRMKANYAETGKKPTPPGNEAPLLWMKDSIQAAAILSKKIPGTQFFVMGGETGGKGYASESTIMKKGMVELGIPEELIGEDPTSSITFENIVNFLNNSKPGQEVDVIISSHHTSRVLFFLELFGVPVRHVYKSQELIRYDLQEKENADIKPEIELDGIEFHDRFKRRAILERLAQQLDVNNTNTFYTGRKNHEEQFPGQKGEEKTPYSLKFTNDNLWMRETLEYPQLFLLRLAGIKSDQQLRQVLGTVAHIYGRKYLEEEFGLRSEDTNEVLREKLTSVPWPPKGYEEEKPDPNDPNSKSNKDLVIEKWRKEHAIETQWPVDLREKLSRLESVKLMNVKPTF